MNRNPQLQGVRKVERVPSRCAQSGVVEDHPHGSIGRLLFSHASRERRDELCGIHGVVDLRRTVQPMVAEPPPTTGVPAAGTRAGSAATRATSKLASSQSASSSNQLACRGSHAIETDVRARSDRKNSPATAESKLSFGGNCTSRHPSFLPSKPASSRNAATSSSVSRSCCVCVIVFGILTENRNSSGTESRHRIHVAARCERWNEELISTTGNRVA